MAIAGAGLCLAIPGVDRSKSLLVPVAFMIAVAFAINLVHAYYPKPGHVVGILLGYCLLRFAERPPGPRPVN